jgi:DNA invertase Pin-like site-specific DNA recombinase
MTNSLVVHQAQLPASLRKFRAAQYVRMSTDKQQYSIENQAAVLAAYAQTHDLSIVRTYRDEGESGLKLKNRKGLIQLLQDVSSNQVDFTHILVYDVSRWGRFQDADESAHYEFICKQAGISVAYCAEQFDNDGSLVSSIVKNIKRVMAAEYSRELSAKVHAGACRFARMGFQLGGLVPYGLQRMLIDEKLQPKGILKRGDRKCLQSDHVKLQPGALKEVTVVKWIFRRFLDVKSEKAIARELNLHGIPAKDGQKWRGPLVTRILKNENYVGNIIYNRRSAKLRGKHVYNPPSAWIRGDGCIEAIIERDIFLAARKIIEERRVDLSEEEMLARLRQTLIKEGRLSPAIITKTVGLPSCHVYMDHFGSLRNAYKLVGYVSNRNCEYIDTRQVWIDQLSKLEAMVKAGIEKIGGRVNPTDPPGGLRVNGTTNIFFRVARWVSLDDKHASARWVIQRRRLPTGWIVAIRLGDQNKSVLDYLLVPTTTTDRNMIRFVEKNRPRLEIDHFESAGALIRSLSRRVTKPSRASSSRPRQLNKQSKSRRPA